MSDQKELSKLEAKGFKVHKFTDYQYRVNDRLDFYANDRDREWRWHDIKTDERGRKPMSQVCYFVQRYFESLPPVGSASTFRSELGWWNCAMPGCSFKMRDDGSSDAARRQFEHLEQHEKVTQ